MPSLLNYAHMSVQVCIYAQMAVFSFTHYPFFLLSRSKDIQLTQDLMELFVDYQIPSDLLSYSGDSDASADTKLVQVHAHVRNVKSTIAHARQQQLDAAALAQQVRTNNYK